MCILSCTCVPISFDNICKLACFYGYHCNPNLMEGLFSLITSIKSVDIKNYNWSPSVGKFALEITLFIILDKILNLFKSCQLLLLYKLMGPL